MINKTKKQKKKIYYTGPEHSVWWTPTPTPLLHERNNVASEISNRNLVIYIYKFC